MVAIQLTEWTMSLGDRTFYGQYVEQKQAKGKNGLANSSSKDV